MYLSLSQGAWCRLTWELRKVGCKIRPWKKSSEIFHPFVDVFVLLDIIKISSDACVVIVTVGEVS